MAKTKSKQPTVTNYADKDFVQVVREGSDEPLPDLVPKSWLGTDLLEDDVVEFKGGSKPTEPVTIPEGEPTDKWTVPQIDLYAETHTVDLGSASTKGEKLPVIVDHYKATNPPAS